jgi:phospholipid/cholesterol/gamma-HCH transport system substrate-binding protein
MESRAHAFAAGLFVLVLGLAAGLTVWWFGSDRDQMVRYVLVSQGSISGLNEQAQVRYRGIRAGKVEAIDIDPDDPRNILVRINVRRNLPVTRGTRATLGYLGVTGIAHVQLSDKGEDPAPLPLGPDGLPRLPLQSGAVEQLSDASLETLRKIQAVADRLGKVVDDANLVRLSRTLERLEAASEGVNRTFKDLPPTLASVRAALSPENLAHLNRILGQLDATSQAATPTVAELRKLAVRLNGVSERVDRLTAGIDSAGTLAHLDALLRELTETSRRMSSLLERVEAAPQVLLFGRGQPAPGPGEAGFEAPPRKE